MAIKSHPGDPVSFGRERMKKIIIFLFIFGFFSQASLSRAAVILFQDDGFSTEDSDGLILDNSDTVGSTNDVTITFGSVLNKNLKWDRVNSYFNLSDSATVTNNLYVSGKSVAGSATMPTSTSVAFNVNGELATRFSTITLVNGTNSNVNIGNSTFVRITGPTANFGIGGIAASPSNVDGQILILYNSTTRNMTTYDQAQAQAAASTATNRIDGLGVGSFITTGEGSIGFIYNGTTSRWIPWFSRT